MATETEMEAWDVQVEKAKKIAQDDMGVEFIYPDINLFKEKVSNVQQEMLDANPNIQDLYDHIQTYNEKYANTSDTKEAK